METAPKSKRTFLLPVLILILMALLVIFGPEEKTLGTGIKVVYVHVSFTWTGLLAFFLVAILSVIGAIWPHESILSWVKTLFGAATAAFFIGFLLSMLASYINWGGVPLQEPRFISAMRILAVAALAGGLMNFIPWARLVSLLGVVPAMMVFFLTQSPRLALHPDSAVGSAPLAIKYTFLGMFALAFTLTFWFGLYFQKKNS
jgi:hypothetical protein